MTVRLVISGTARNEAKCRGQAASGVPLGPSLADRALRPRALSGSPARQSSSRTPLLLSDYFGWHTRPFTVGDCRASGDPRTGYGYRPGTGHGVHVRRLYQPAPSRPGHRRRHPLPHLRNPGLPRVSSSSFLRPRGQLCRAQSSESLAAESREDLVFPGARPEASGSGESKNASGHLCPQLGLGTRRNGGILPGVSPASLVGRMAVEAFGRVQCPVQESSSVIANMFRRSADW
jgi:hypothetical protein